MPNTTKDNFLAWLKLILNATTYRIKGGLEDSTLLSLVLGGTDPKTIGYDISLQSKTEETPATSNKLTLTVSADIFENSNTESIIAAILAARGVTSVRVHFPEEMNYQEEEEYNFVAKLLSDDDFGKDRKFLTPDLIKKWSLIPLNRIGNQLFIATTNPHNEMADDVRMVTGYDHITIYRIVPADYQRYKDKIPD